MPPSGDCSESSSVLWLMGLFSVIVSTSIPKIPWGIGTHHCCYSVFTPTSALAHFSVFSLPSSQNRQDGRIAYTCHWLPFKWRWIYYFVPFYICPYTLSGGIYLISEKHWTTPRKDICWIKWKLGRCVWPTHIVTLGFSHNHNDSILCQDVVDILNDVFLEPNKILISVDTGVRCRPDIEFKPLDIAYHWLIMLVSDVEWVSAVMLHFLVTVTITVTSV